MISRFPCYVEKEDFDQLRKLSLEYALSMSTFPLAPARSFLSPEAMRGPRNPIRTIVIYSKINTVQINGIVKFGL